MDFAHVVERKKYMNLLDLHTHTVASNHAYSTLIENIFAAKAKGLKYLGVSDHAPKMPDAPHIFYFSNLRVIPPIIEGIRILKGAELNILNYNGDIDLDERTLEGLDYAIASLHIPCYKNLGIEGNTQALINAMKHPKVKIIGHPDDSRYPLDYKRVAEAAKANQVLLEVNNSSLLPTSSREGGRECYLELLPYCIKYQVPIIIGSDAHFIDKIGAYENALALLEEVQFPKELIVNFNEDLFTKYLSL